MNCKQLVAGRFYTVTSPGRFYGMTGRLVDHEFGYMTSLDFNGFDWISPKSLNFRRATDKEELEWRRERELCEDV